MGWWGCFHLLHKVKENVQYLIVFMSSSTNIQAKILDFAVDAELECIESVEF